MSIKAIRSARAVRRFARSALMRTMDWFPQMRPRVLLRLPRGSRDLAVTFDDGPDPEITPRVLDLLEVHRWKATFFVVGRRAEKHPGLLRLIVSAGHQVGNHTYSHVRCRGLGEEAFLNELSRTDALIQAASAGVSEPALFRPPWGSLTPVQAACLWRRGRGIGLWSISCDDSGPEASRPAACDAALSARSRDIVLLHDTSPVVLDVLGVMLPELGGRGLRSVALGLDGSSLNNDAPSTSGSP